MLVLGRQTLLRDLSRSVLLATFFAFCFFKPFLCLLHMLVFKSVRLLVFVCNLDRRLAVISGEAQICRNINKVNQAFIHQGLLLIDEGFIVEMMHARDCLKPSSLKLKYINAGFILESNQLP